MEEVVLALAIVLAIWGTVAASRRSRRTGPPGVGSQIVAGVACGIAGALFAAVPHADVIPDGAEPVLIVGLGTLVLGLAAVSLARWSIRRRNARAARPGRHAHKQSGSVSFRG